MTSDAQLDHSRCDLLSNNSDARDGNGQLEPPRASAARIEKEQAIFVLDGGSMGMTADHDLDIRVFREFQFFDVVDDAKTHLSGPRFCEYGQRIGPAAHVVVPAHCDHRSQGTQTFKHLRRSDITRMDDQVGFAQCPDRFRPQEAVRV